MGRGLTGCMADLMNGCFMVPLLMLGALLALAATRLVRARR